MNDIPVSSGDGVTTSSLPPLPPLATSLPPSSLPLAPLSSPTSLPSPSPPQVWLTIQDFSMFINTATAPPSTRPITRKYFTLCSLAEHISQFSLTDPNAPKNAKTDDEYLMYQDLYSNFPSAIRTMTMTLYFMYHAPQFNLPLAPFHDAIYSAIEFTYTFWWGHRSSMSSFNTICRLVSGVLSNRIGHAVSGLYSDLKIVQGDSIPQLERDRPAILEWLARDTLAAFNPIEMMLMYYRPIITEFNQIPSPTSEDRLRCFNKVKGITPWLRDMHSICMMYGLHIHDSQWVSMDVLKELADYMDIIATKIAPDLFDVVRGKHPAPTSGEDGNRISSTKSWYEAFLYCIAPCFTHYYRPMGKPDQYAVPYGNWPSSETVECHFPPTEFLKMLAVSLPTALEQYATMYVEDPQQFECEGSQSVSLPPPPHGTNDDNSPSLIRQTFEEVICNTSPSLERQIFDHTRYYQKLTMELPTYTPKFRQIQFLLRAIVESPPVDDPVYMLFTSWFTLIADHLRLMKLDSSMDPQFTSYNRTSSSSSSSLSST